MHEVIGACPLDCPDGCSWVVTVDAGKAVKLRGNPDHPFTDGGLCKKVNPWLDYAADPFRILHPLKRVGPKGAGEFERVTWEHALSDIAARLIEVRDRCGGEAIWPFTGTGNVGFIQGAGLPAGVRLMNLLGASQHSISICSVSGHVGLSYSQGPANGMDPEQIVHAGVIMLWGANVLVTNQHLWPFIEKARANNSIIISVDPVGTRTAQRSDHHLQLRPGTDGALALALCRLVRDRGGQDEQWLQHNTEGWEEFSELLNHWPAERGAKVCGLAVEQLHTVADLIVSSRRPLAIKLGQGMQRHAHGGQAARSVSCLTGMLGSYQHRGGGLVYSTSPAYATNHEAAAMRTLAPGPTRRFAMTNLVDVLENADPPVEAIIISGANPVVSNPDSTGVQRALARNDLLTVAIELFPTPTTAFADYILPSSMQHEQHEMNDSFSHYYLHWNEKAVEPAGEALSHTEIYRRLAIALTRHDSAFADPALQATEEDYARALMETDEFRSAGLTFDALRKTGWLRLPEPPPIRTFTFASDRAERDGLSRLPEWRGLKEPTDGTGGYELVANGSDWHINTVFSQTAKTLDRTNEPPVIISSSDAARDRLASGQRVSVGNNRGSFTAQLIVDDVIARAGVASISKGWGPQLVNATVREEDSDTGNGAVFHDNLVWITSAPTSTENHEPA
ncbi:MAG: molybdopterin-dependent oxidoreductase [Acidimicrobiales bacterium]|nr:molybdopterin-dependent oxidoreductase [Acidimicrobiales bacterium]